MTATETERLFTTTLPWTVALMLVLGLVGGALMSRNMLRAAGFHQPHQPRDHGRRSVAPRAGRRRAATSSTRWPTISTACWTASSG